MEKSFLISIWKKERKEKDTIIIGYKIKSFSAVTRLIRGNRYGLCQEKELKLEPKLNAFITFVNRHDKMHHDNVEKNKHRQH